MSFNLTKNANWECDPLLSFQISESGSKINSKIDKFRKALTQKQVWHFPSMYSKTASLPFRCKFKKNLRKTDAGGLDTAGSTDFTSRWLMGLGRRSIWNLVKKSGPVGLFLISFVIIRSNNFELFLFHIHFFTKRISCQVKWKSFTKEIKVFCIAKTSLTKWNWFPKNWNTFTVNVHFWPFFRA